MCKTGEIGGTGFVGVEVCYLLLCTKILEEPIYHEPVNLVSFCQT